MRADDVDEEVGEGFVAVLLFYRVLFLAFYAFSSRLGSKLKISGIEESA